MNTVALVGLLKIELPAATVRLCDGGVIYWGAETFRAKDPLFGTIGNFGELGEGIGDEVPAFEITFLPPEGVDPEDLAAEGYQTARVSIWIAEFDPATSAVIGTPDLMFLGQLDMIELSVDGSGGDKRRELQCSVVSLAERLFTRNEGNTLSEAFHKSVWPGETGQDSANGLTITVAWGTESAGQGRPSFFNPGSWGGPTWQDLYR